MKQAKAFSLHYGKFDVNQRKKFSLWKKKKLLTKWKVFQWMSIASKGDRPYGCCSFILTVSVVDGGTRNPLIKQVIFFFFTEIYSRALVLWFHLWVFVIGRLCIQKFLWLWRCLPRFAWISDRKLWSQF